VKLPIFDEIFETAMSSSFQLTAQQENKLLNMQTCRTIVRGGQIIVCPDCRTKIVNYLPCNQRGCVFCYEKNQIKWRKKVSRRLLSISHYHLVFSIPEVFTITWIRNKEAFTNAMFSCVSESIKELGEEYGVVFGSILAFQSHGKGMCRKLHVHCCLTAGGLSEDKKWVEIKSLPYTKLSEKMQEKFYRRLEKTISIADLPDKKIINKREYKVHPTYHQKTGKAIIRYLSHSVFGVVINMRQQFLINKENGTIGFSEDHVGKHTETFLGKEEFTKRYLSHIPPIGLVMVRSYGLYSNRYKEELKELRKELEEQYGCEEIEEEKIINPCPVCQCQMIVDLTFSANPVEWPSLIKNWYMHDPPEHGAIIVKGKRVA